jgi:hypothetical protein
LGGAPGLFVWPSWETRAWQGVQNGLRLRPKWGRSGPDRRRGRDTLPPLALPAPGGRGSLASGLQEAGMLRDIDNGLALWIDQIVAGGVVLFVPGLTLMWWWARGG